MRTYKSKEVIELVEEWHTYVHAYRLEHKYDDLHDWLLFEDWLEEKEQSELPIINRKHLDSLFNLLSKSFYSIPSPIWVKETNSDQWFKRQYYKIVNNKIVTVSILGSMEIWDEYSLTDPNS